MASSVQAWPYSWPHDEPMSPETTALVIIDMQKDCKCNSIDYTTRYLLISTLPLLRTTITFPPPLLFSLFLLSYYPTTSFFEAYTLPVCCDGGYLSQYGCDITPVKLIIPNIQNLLTNFRKHNFQIYHTREGHRPDLSSLSSRELHRSRLNDSGIGIGDQGPLGRLLIRGEAGHDIIEELYPIPGEPVIDKPGKSAFQHTDFGLLLAVKGITKLVICGVTTDVCVSSTMRDANDRGLECLLVEDACAASEQYLHSGAVQSVQGEGGIFGAVAKTKDVLDQLNCMPIEVNDSE